MPFSLVYEPFQLSQTVRSYGREPEITKHSTSKGSIGGKMLIWIDIFHLSSALPRPASAQQTCPEGLGAVAW